jgi:hypothetical protein
VFPRKLWTQIVVRVARQLDHEQMVNPNVHRGMGYEPLRLATASYLRIARDITCSACGLNNAVIYDILFRAAAETLQTIAADRQHLGAAIGVTAVLHTWGQNLFHHPHIHCIVPGGGVSPDGRWIACRPGFFLSVRVLSRLYRRLFLERLQAAFNAGRLNFFGELAGLIKPAAFATHLRPLRRVEWVVYAKRPFGGPQQVLDYLGRYTQPGRDLQQSAHRCGRRRGPLPLEGLPALATP